MHTHYKPHAYVYKYTSIRSPHMYIHEYVHVRIYIYKYTHRIHYTHTYISIPPCGRRAWQHLLNLQTRTDSPSLEFRPEKHASHPTNVSIFFSTRLHICNMFTYFNIYLHWHVCMYIYINICTYVYICMCIYICMYIYIRNLYIYIFMCVYINTYWHACKRTHIYYIHLYVYTHSNIYLNMCIYLRNVLGIFLEAHHLLILEQAAVVLQFHWHAAALFALRPPKKKPQTHPTKCYFGLLMWDAAIVFWVKSLWQKCKWCVCVCAYVCVCVCVCTRAWWCMQKW